MRRDRFVLLLLVALTLGAFWRVSLCDFVNYDDNDYVTANPVVQKGLTVKGLAWAFGQLHGEKTYWHPLTWFSHMLDCQLFGLKAGAHHVINLFLHTLNVALLFLVLKRMTGWLWRGALVAAFWAVHPLQVDTVAWISERKNLLSTLFWLLSMGAYVRYAEKPKVSRYLLVLLGMALGLMCKPVLVTLPCALLLLDVWPLRRFRFARSLGIERGTGNAERGMGGPPSSACRIPISSFGRLITEKLLLLALAGVSSWITVHSHEGLNITQASTGLPLGLRFANAFVSYLRYLKKVFWPDDLAVLYPHPGMWPGDTVLGSVLLLLLITGLVLWGTRCAPYLLVGWLWFIGVLVPSIGILQIGTQAMADRFVYQPLIGLLILIVWAAADWAGHWPARQKLMKAVAILALFGCVIMTWRQIGFWKDSISLYQRAVAVTRNNYVMESNLAFTLHEAGRLDEAKAHALAAVQANPNHFPAHLILALICEGQDHLDEAAVHYRKALSVKPGWLEAMKGYGSLLLRQGRLDDAYAQLAPLSKAVPSDYEVHLQLAVLLGTQKKTAEAIRHYREALRLYPDWPEALNNLAWLLATRPEAQFRDGAEAVRLAERACELTQRKKPVYVGTLAAAYAEAGRFDDAVKTAQQAIDVATSGGEKDLAETNTRLLELYRARKAYREEAK
jgi:tetratricopeptide (TPR) repeat protein